MPYLLGRHVSCCPRGSSCAGERLRQTFGRRSFGYCSARCLRFLQTHFAAGQLRQSEVQYLYRARLAQENVRRLNVAVNDVLVVGSLQSVGDLRRDV